RREIMQAIADGRVIHAGTLNAHVASVAAALTSLRLLEADHASAYRRLHELSEQLRSRLVEPSGRAGQAVLMTGPGPVFHMGFLRQETNSTARAGGLAILNYRDVLRTYDFEKYARFVRAMAQRGVRLIGRGIWYLSTAHTQADVDQTVDVARSALAEIT